MQKFPTNKLNYFLSYSFFKNKKKEKYRKFKDQHILTTCLRQLSTLCPLPSHPTPISMLSLGSTLSSANDTISYLTLPNNNPTLFSTKPTITSSLSTNSQPQPPQQHQLQTNLTTSKLTYSSLLKIVEHLKLVLEIAVSRAPNWQRFCLQNPSTILFLVELALLMGVDANGSGSDSSNLSGSSSISMASTSVIVPTILQCIVCSLGSSKLSSTSSSSSMQSSNKPMAASVSQAAPNKSLSSSKTSTTRILLNDDPFTLASLVSSLIFKSLPKDTLVRFMRTYLLDAFSAQIRWSMHALLYALHKTAPQDPTLYELMLQLWPDAALSAKSAQYIDLLGYISLKSPAQCKELLQKSIEMFQYTSSVLTSHPNSSLYTSLSGLMGTTTSDIGGSSLVAAGLGGFDGYYLEAEPCFVCNNIEAPLVNIKLNSIKADSRFTTSQQIFKLIGSHAISKLIIKISDIRL
jgi:E3 ubiquitin-protein ligase UBR4